MSIQSQRGGPQQETSVPNGRHTFSSWMQSFILRASNFHLRAAVMFVYQMSIGYLLLINKHASSLNE